LLDAHGDVGQVRWGIFWNLNLIGVVDVLDDSGVDLLAVQGLHQLPQRLQIYC
jgi:hypothetical protein